MITRLSIAFEDFLGSSIAPQVMPPRDILMLVVGGGDGKEMSLFVHIENTEPFKEGKKISTC